ncbi:NrfD/PsrC family molybdoenzyme membrane anchor subunit [Varunaivibrio sulfuroxidans]|uniref:Tetrathionate reductase subunit C n=1 Tax=Varunaivibrio sulfuroxidans TaxID=1773489 RepID=A0A4R3J722_9PROT|nr:NrfD/PsrC family molybdoenzyme membrane anchor subunit [Varunaivibrio sulfuroxidans]TCS61207.1 tetrathionate reductase subunit C [Varunaivibrio sulfuroxidans]WES31172.1 polysulfide reductase NrfD [Varunaivibrio sulfuroxidans]
MNTNIIELINNSQPVAWLPWAVQYFFLIGISVACFFLTVPAFVFGRTDWEKISRIALIGALSMGVAAPIALLADLHQPGRFMNFYLHFMPGSWMSWGSFFIPIYLIALFAYAWTIYRPALAELGEGDRALAPIYRLVAMGGDRTPGLTRLIGLAAIVAAILVFTYTGAEVAVVRARPLWNTPLLPLQFIATGFVGALGLILLLNRTVGDSDMVVETKTNRMLAIFLAIAMIIGFVWFALGIFGISSVIATALSSVSGSAAWRETVVWAIAATAIPFLIAVIRPQGSGWVTGLIALHVAWIFRWAVFIGGQGVPKTGAGLYSFALPNGPEGLLGIIGTAGLWFFLIIVITSFVPWRKDDSGTPSANA